ncbi:MAG: N-acetylglucosamine-6-phosphate deacetylase [Candidatus Omnitrophica bacterium]|nr:N-acetylglucosamine-6-phosphate deacetylase [Candidatus Omnitrophota bacterium]
MPTILINHGDIILKDRLLKGSSVLIEGTRIKSVGKILRTKADIVIDARCCYVSPGFIDTHIHGDPADIFPYEVKHGTTAIVVAVSCASLDEIFKTAQKIKTFMKEDRLGCEVLGFRLEGPYINIKKAGAQDKRYIRRPDKRELALIIKRCTPALKMVTIAPELGGALPLISLLSKKGIIPSIGHSYATAIQAIKGVEAGIRHATHFFNAMRLPAGKEGGVAGAVISDGRIWAEVILDRIHVPPAMFLLLLRAKGPGKVVLITDSVKACDQKGVRKFKGAYRFSDGKLAGSCLTMIKAVHNAVCCGLTLPEAVRLASYNPAKMLGEHSRKGSIANGKDADILIFDKDFDVKLVLARGKIMFQKKGAPIHVRYSGLHR